MTRPCCGCTAPAERPRTDPRQEGRPAPSSLCPQMDEQLSVNLQLSLPTHPHGFVLSGHCHWLAVPAAHPCANPSSRAQLRAFPRRLEQAVELPEKMAEMLGAQKLRTSPHYPKRKKTSSNFHSFSFGALNITICKQTAGLWFADTALRVLQIHNRGVRENDKCASKAALQNTHFMCRQQGLCIPQPPRLEGIAFSFKSADHTVSKKNIF